MFKSKKILSLIISVCLCFTALVPTVSAQDTPDYATREYVISQFVQSVGRNYLEDSDAVLAIFTDSHKISAQYKEDISRAIIGGILKGYDDRTIRPSEPISRVEAMVMLARCVPDLEQTNEPIEFTDVPQWAKDDITYLSKVGLVKGYGDGTMGADDLITVDQVALLVERSDEALSEVTAGESFYGYVNEKTFRNVSLDNPMQIDPIHGAVITNKDSWSVFNDVANKIVENEKEILSKLVNGEIEYEKGSPEQRVFDMLNCIDADVAANESDIKNITDMRNAILNAKNINEFLDVATDIYKLAGINIVFDISVNPDEETGIAYPILSIASTGNAGLIAYREKTDTQEYRDVYIDLVDKYFDTIGVEFSKEDIEASIKFDCDSSMDKDFFNTICLWFNFALSAGLIDEATLQSELKAIVTRNIDLFNTETGTYIGPSAMFVTKDKEEADATYTGFDVCEELTGYGFTNLEKIISPIGKIAEAEKNLICEENLNALKINALLVLNENLTVKTTEEEKDAAQRLAYFPFIMTITNNAEELRNSMFPQDEEKTENEEAFQESAGVGFDEGLLSAVNLNLLNQLLPNDIGLIYTKYYYDDEISYKTIDMVQDIGKAYFERFQNNTWMSDETKANAIKKLEKMLVVIGYPDNYTFPEIVPISEGGSLFSNTLSIKRNEVAEIIRCNEDKEFIRTRMYLPPDEVNACYIPAFNAINIPAGILNPPFYDPNASYAANLGAIGMVIAHEIGHAFDKIGATYDENGCLKNWWTEEDYAEFEKIQEKFVEYYNKFEVVDGVIQDANITITENMADYAAMQIIMDIIGDDKEAQKECLESYARMWARLGTVSFLTDNSLLSNEHASNVVRINAIVASFEQFYDLYDVKEGDPMYIAPEDRLRLW